MSVYGKAASAILGGISDAEKTTRARQQEKERRELAQFQHAQMLAALTEQGYGIGEAPAEAPTFDGGLADAQGKVAPITRSPSRYEQITPGKQGVYRDTTRTPEARRAKAEAEVARRQEERDRRTEERAIRLEQVRQQGRAPTAPVMGSPEWKEAKRYGAQVGAEFRPASPDPIETHQANRAFDVANPLPVQRVPRQPTEVQSRARLVYPRAASAAKNLERFYKDGAPLKAQAGKLGIIGNYALTKDEQLMNQAGEAVASAILRLESGAAISKGEAQSYARQFLPAPNDSKEMRAQKWETLQVQLRAMEELAGDAPPSASHDTPGNVDLGKPSLAERVKQLKAQGMDKEKAKATLKAEGYEVPE